MNPENPGNHPSNGETPSDQPVQPRKFTRREIIAGAVGLATGIGAGKILLDRFGNPREKKEENDLIDESSPDFFIDFPDGEFDEAERTERTSTIAPGVTVFRDIGVTFYLVQRGDTIDYIRAKLSTIPEFEYLANQIIKIQSFNIPENSLEPDMYIPIPMENKDRHISDEKFAVHALRALRHLSEHPKYGKFVKPLRGARTDTDIIASMIAFAKQESGDDPIGQFEMHRYEPAHAAFSFSLFHVLMVGSGLRARRRLNRTEGQLYHPQNGAEVFLAFMIEKLDEMFGESDSQLQRMSDRFIQLFDFNEDTASFYNGRRWRRNNPHYLENIQEYKREALIMLQNVNFDPR